MCVCMVIGVYLVCVLVSVVCGVRVGVACVLHNSNICAHVFFYFDMHAVLKTTLSVRKSNITIKGVNGMNICAIQNSPKHK